MNNISATSATTPMSGTNGTSSFEPSTISISDVEIVAETAAIQVEENSGALHTTLATHQIPLDQNPAAVYLAHLTPGGQRTMGEALNKIASLLTAGQANALTCRWSALRFQHTAAVRAKLAATYKPATANRMIC